MKKLVREYIENQILISPVKFMDSESLYDLNILNSLSLVRLINYINGELKIKIELVDIQNIEDFETIDNIVKFLNEYTNKTI